MVGLMETLTLDRNALIGEIAAKFNLLLSEDDPIFATVILNELVLSKFIDVASNELAGMLVLIQHVRSSIESSTGDSASRMNLQTEKILNSIEQLRIDATELDKMRIKNIEVAAKSSAESATQEFYKRITERLEPTMKAVTSGIDQSIINLNDSFTRVQKLHSETALSSVNTVNKAILKLKSHREETVLYCIVASIVGSAIGSGVIAVFRMIL